MHCQIWLNLLMDDYHFNYNVSNSQNKYWQGSKGGMIFINIIVKYSIVYYKSCLPPLDFFSFKNVSCAQIKPY